MTPLRNFIPQSLFGTIITATASEDNPAHEPGYEKYYVPGFVEILITNDGLNPHFLKGKWRFRLVSFKDGLGRRQERLSDENGPFEQVTVDPDMELTRAETHITKVADKEVGCVRLSFYSTQRRQTHEVIAFWNDEEDEIEQEPRKKAVGA